MREAIACGATIEEAQELALNELGVTGDENVEFEVLDLPQKKTLGLFGGSLARVRAFIEDEAPEKSAAAVAKAEKSEAGAKGQKPKRGKPAGTPAVASAAAPRQPRKREQPEKRNIVDPEKKTAVSIEFLKSVAGSIGFENLEITPVARDDGAEFQINGENLGVLIGHRGETLDALQYLTSLVANRRREGDFFRVLLNTGDYREKREETLEHVAERTVSQVKRSGRSQTLEPMNAYERRIIHTVVQDVEGFASWSVGSGDSRRVVIGYEKNVGETPSPERRGRDGRYGRDRDNRDSRYGGERRGRNNRFDRPDNTVTVTETREPRSDAAETPLYGRIDKKD